MDPLLRFRSEFPILSRTNYLVSNSLGAMPRTVPARLAEYGDAWAADGVRAWANGWWEMPVAVGDVIAPLLGAGAGEVVMAPNVSLAQAMVISAIDFSSPRDGLVTTALDFPSVRYVYDGLGRRLGARIVEVPSEDGIGVDTEALLAAIDERTRLVAISHVLFRSAFVIDIDAVCRRAREAGALVMLDAFHSVGVMPVDVGATGAHFLTGGVLKWLCGGPGGCFLYVSPEIRDELAPGVTGWQSHARPFSFELGHEPAAGSFRWLTGTPSIPALYAATEGPRLVSEAGIGPIREKNRRQTARLIELADARGYPVQAPRDPDLRGGAVALAVPNAEAVAQALLARDIIVDYRPDAGIRIAPHFYTSDDEIEESVHAIEEILEKGSWREFVEESRTVT
jgi:kynureninase